MASFGLTIVLLIEVLQVLDVIPKFDKKTNREEETDVTKLFSESELQRAKIAGLNDQALIEGRSYGLSFEEVMKLKQIQSIPENMRGNTTFNFVVWSEIVKNKNRRSFFSVSRLKYVRLWLLDTKLQQIIPKRRKFI